RSETKGCASVAGAPLPLVAGLRPRDAAVAAGLALGAVLAAGIGIEGRRGLVGEGEQAGERRPRRGGGRREIREGGGSRQRQGQHGEQGLHAETPGWRDIKRLTMC